MKTHVSMKLMEDLEMESSDEEQDIDKIELQQLRVTRTSFSTLSKFVITMKSAICCALFPVRTIQQSTHCLSSHSHVDTNQFTEHRVTYVKTSLHRKT